MSKEKNTPTAETKAPARSGRSELRGLARRISHRSARGTDSNDPQMNLLTQTELLEEAGPSRITRSSMLTAAAMVAVAICWASMAQVDEVASGPGEVVPANSIKVVQHLEGGIVQAIFIKEGKLVKKGALLLSLRTESAGAELDQLRAREIALSLRSRRLHAFVTGKPLKVKASDVPARYRDLIKEELAILKLQERTAQLQRRVIEQQVSQKQSELKILTETVTSTQKQLDVVKESLDLRDTGVKRGVVPRALYLQTRREYERVSGELRETRARIGRVKHELAEARARLAEHELRSRRQAIEERGKVLGELAQVRERLTKLRDRVRRLEIRAPVTGYVKGLRVHTVGAVITNDGKPLMEIVPADRDLLVEARISTRDIGHVRVGQAVQIKVDTFDYSRYGAMTGRVQRISAATFLDKDGRPYYRATIDLNTTHVGGAKSDLALAPGMTVTADVVTGSKTVLTYLVKPVIRALQGGLRER